MLSINNTSLPPPGKLDIALIPAAASPSGPLVRLRVQAEWAGQSAASMQQILTGTGAGFTLACLDPRTGEPRGFPARLTLCRAGLLDLRPGRPALYHLQVAFEEDE